MRGRRGRSTGRRIRRSEKSRKKVARAAQGARKDRRSASAQRAIKRSRVVRRDRHAQGAGSRRASRLYGEPGYRRVGVRRAVGAKRRLSPGVLPALRRDASQKDQQVSRRVCARAKQERRAVIIATGYGGRNGARDYARRKSCR